MVKIIAEFLKVAQEHWSLIILMMLSTVIGVMLGGVLIPFFWNMDFRTIDVAVSHSSTIADFGTVLGAVLTFFTLCFLIWQNMQTQKAQQDYQTKQNELWAEQKKLMVFQRYQGHRDDFDRLLDELSRDNNIAFFKRDGLYQTLFPNNGPLHCSVEPSKHHFNSLHRIEARFNKNQQEICSIYNLEGQDRQLEMVSSYISDAAFIMSSLHFRFNFHDLNSTFRIGDFHVVDLFNLELIPTITAKVIYKLKRFGGLPYEPSDEPFFQPMPDFPFVLYAKTPQSQKHNITLPLCSAYQRKVLYFLIASMRILPSSTNDARIVSLVRKLKELCRDYEAFCSLVNDQSTCHKLVQQVIDAIKNHRMSQHALQESQRTDVQHLLEMESELILKPIFG